jgi:SM-20-related protein
MVDETDANVPREIDVTVLLMGGHQGTLSMGTNDPLLWKLFEAALTSTGKHAEEIFQLPINKGRAMLSFRGDRVVGVITDPPLVLQPRTEDDAPAAPEANNNNPAATAPPTVSNNPVVYPTPIQPVASPVYPSQFVQLDNFLTPAEYKGLLTYAVQKQAAFVSTTTSTGAEDYRESKVLHVFPEFSSLITKRIQAIVPQILEKFSIPNFPVAEVEAQLTAHNDGSFYKVHNDNGSPETASRELTYVYYFSRQPKPFKGGELRIYDSKVENNFYVQADTYKTVEPRNNSIVFFLSRYMHEVLPIQCPSKAFADSRFTVNGWVRR